MCDERSRWHNDLHAMGIRTAVLCALAALATLVPRALGDIEAASAAASIRFGPTVTPPALAAGDFTVLVWYRPSGIAEAQAGILQIPGLATLRIDPGNGVTGTITKGGAGGTTAAAAANLQLAPGEWALLAISLRTSDGRFFVFAQGESTPLKVGAVTVPALAGSVAGPVTGDMAIGSSPSGLPAAQGLYGMIAVRTHWLQASDFAAVWNSRRHWAAFDADNTAAGGNMAGPGGCVWMTNHAMTTGPLDAVGVFTFDRAAVVGQPVGTGNVHVYTSLGVWAGELAVVRPVTAAAGFVYRSHSDPPYDGFFVPDLPGSGIARDVVARPSPLARQMVTGPQQPLRIVVGSNSRGMGGHDGSAFAPSNYAHGFIELERARVMGILLRPAILSSGGGTWFGFDTQQSSPPQSGPGTIVAISGDPSPSGTFSRFWTGSMSGTSLGPGEGLLLRPGAHYAMRCKPEPGSLIAADAPLTVAAYVLRYPGSSGVTWRPGKGVNQGGDGYLGPGTAVSLDSTSWTRVLQAGDHMQGSTALVVSDDQTDGVHAGDAVFVSAGTGVGSISVVTGVVFDGTSTTITFSHPFFGAPAVGSTVRAGAWAFERIEYAWAALDPGDPQVWRGLRLEADTAGAGVVVFSFSAWRPGVDGYAFGTAGWGGHGYQQQIDQSFPGSIEALSSAAGAQVWVQVPAQQWSEPSSMSTWTHRLRVGSPGMEVVWAGELQHATQYPAKGPEAWGQYILDHAAAEGVVGLVSFEHPRLGDFRQQLADGLRKDGEHLSQRGNRVQAGVWTELLERGALPACRPDLNGDGVLNLADFGAFQTLLALGDPRADFNNDGVLNLADFGAFQNTFAFGC